MGLLHHGGMGKVFADDYAPATLGQFLRSFTFGYVRQVDIVASCLLPDLAEHTDPLGTEGASGPVIVDIDDTIVEVHVYAKQGAPSATPVAWIERAAREGLDAQVAPVIAA